MCIRKKVKLINHDCLPVLMLLYIMLFAALSNTVFLYNAFFILIFANAICLYAMSWFIGIEYVYFKYDLASYTVLLMFFPNSMFTPFLFCVHERAMCSLEK